MRMLHTEAVAIWRNHIERQQNRLPGPSFCFLSIYIPLAVIRGKGFVVLWLGVSWGAPCKGRLECTHHPQPRGLTWECREASLDSHTSGCRLLSFAAHQEAKVGCSVCSPNG